MWRLVERLAPWIAAGLAAAALIASLLPGVPMPSFALGDKLVHAVAYAALAISWVLGLRWRWTRWPRTTAWLAVVAYGLAIELLQGLTPWRRFEGLDLLANALGAAAGVLIAAALQRARFGDRSSR